MAEEGMPLRRPPGKTIFLFALPSLLSLLISASNGCHTPQASVLRARSELQVVHPIVSIRSSRPWPQTALLQPEYHSLLFPRSCARVDQRQK